jgi:hypothetical protein
VQIPERVFYGALWLGLVGYWALLAPPPSEDTLGQIVALARLDSRVVDPIAVAVFNLLGVIPTAFLALLLSETGRPSPWPFALGAYLLGGLVLLPYLALRDTTAPLSPRPGGLVRAIGSRTAGGILLSIALALITYGVITGSPARFGEQLTSSLFIAVMTADLIALTLALHRAAATDRTRRGIEPARPQAAQRIPLLGPLLYLATR